MSRIALTGKLMVQPGNQPSASVYLNEPLQTGQRRLFYMKCPKQFLDVVSGPDWTAEISYTADPFGHRPSAVKLLNKTVDEEPTCLVSSEEHGTC